MGSGDGRLPSRLLLFNREPFTALGKALFLNITSTVGEFPRLVITLTMDAKYYIVNILLSSPGNKLLDLKLSSYTYHFSNEIKNRSSPYKCAWWHMNLLIMLSWLIML